MNVVAGFETHILGICSLAPYAACYKPNVAFFEALGVYGGMACLERVIQAIPDDIPVLLDVKRGDIGSTAAAYATACYDHLKADAVTLSPLMGWDSIAPFVTGMYILVDMICRFLLHAIVYLCYTLVFR